MIPKRAKDLDIKGTIEKTYREIKGQIEANRARYPNARDDEVWRLLGVQDESGQPLYSVSSAMEKSHKEMTSYLIKNIVKYTVGLPILLLGSGFILAFGTLVSIVTGEWEELGKTLDSIWRPIK